MNLSESYKKRLQELGGVKATELPKIEWNGKQYYVDARLKQLRSAVPFPEQIEFINIDDLDDNQWDSFSEEARDTIVKELIRVGAY